MTEQVSEYAPIDYEFSNEYVVIDPFTCDLNLIVDRECLLAYPMSGEGFNSMWAGCKSTFGIGILDDVKTAFEVHLEDYCDDPLLPKDDIDSFQLRVGWSLNETSLQLGEEVFSYAYCSNGKKCCNKVFEDYGEPFQKGDSIAAYYDFKKDSENILISFSKNGLDLGEAFRISKDDLIKHAEMQSARNVNIQSDESQVKLVNENYKEEYSFKIIFFPHVLSKNYVFEMNFGQRVSLIGDEPFAPIKADFNLIQKLSPDLRSSNENQMLKKSDCEVIFMVGLPGSGKTHWLNQYLKSNSKKNYSVIGVSSMFEKMRSLGIKKKNQPNNTVTTSEAVQIMYNSSSKVLPDLLDKILKCMNILIEIGSQANRNIVLDLANCYKSARRRKFKYFEGYGLKRAVVVVPSDEEYKERLKKSEAEDGKEIPIILVNDMKSNFKLPDASEFDSIEYVELKEEEAAKLVESYNNEGTTDRSNFNINKRNKISEEKREINIAKMGSLSLLRPGIRQHAQIGSNLPQFMPMIPGGVGIPYTSYGNRYPNSGNRYPSAPGARRPFPSNYQQRGQGIYQQQMPIDFNNPNYYAHPSQMASFNAYLPPPSVQNQNLLQRWPGSYQQQQQQIMSQNNWAPAMPLNAAYQTQQSVLVNYMQPNTNAAFQSGQQQNNWNPAISTNLSSYISASSSSVSAAYSTNLTSQNDNNTNHNN